MARPLFFDNLDITSLPTPILSTLLTPWRSPFGFTGRFRTEAALLKRQVGHFCSHIPGLSQPGRVKVY